LYLQWSLSYKATLFCNEKNDLSGGVASLGEGRGDNSIVFHYLCAFEIRPYKRGGISWEGETI
jgi:hypothetical protein